MNCFINIIKVFGVRCSGDFASGLFRQGDKLVSGIRDFLFIET
jgi:hypothetical protein